MQEIASDQICLLISKLRQYHAKVDQMVPERADNYVDDDGGEVLFDSAEDSVEEEIRAFIESLNEDQQIELRALLAVGSGRFASEDWAAVLVAMRDNPDARRADAYLSSPHAADYLLDALTQLGFACDDVDNG